MTSQNLHIGDSGWRAIYTEGFTLDKLSAIALSFTELFPKQKALIGYDNRFLSQEFGQHFGQLLEQNSWKVDLISEIFPTPGVAVLTKNLGYDWGFVITASHNPFYYNGLKILDRNGLLSSASLNKKIEEKASQKLQKEKLPSLFPQKKLPSFSFLKAQSFYLRQILSHVEIKKIQRANLKVVWDSFGGTSTSLFAAFLKKCKILGKGLPWPNEPTFGHRRLEPDLISLQTLKISLRKWKANLGLATDIDGDRFAVLDEKGHFMLPNIIGPLLTWYLLGKRKEKGTIYQTVSGSQLTLQICKYFGVPCKEMPVGFQKMGQGMHEDPQALLGLEETGGIAYAPHLCFKDGLMAHALLLEMLVNTQESLSRLKSQMYKKFGEYHYHRMDFHLESETQKRKWLNLKVWEKCVGEKALRVSTLDGNKLYFPSGWVLIRNSKTEPLLRIYFESQRKEFVKKIRSQLSK